MEKISIVISGHTNTGKTTLICTLMKSSVGEVGDRANVTVKGQSYFYDGLQADFVDTPGFRFASLYNQYLEESFGNPNYVMSNILKKKIDLDLEAGKAIKGSNVALYVGDLLFVPDESYAEEVAVVKKIQPHIIGILNKAHACSMMDNTGKTVKHRIELWKQWFYENGIDRVVVFDAHWDRYSKVSQIYDHINAVISKCEQEIFAIGLKRFKEREVAIRKEACSMLSMSIEKLQKIQIEYKRNRYSKEDATVQIVNATTESVLEFVNAVKELYKIASEYPTDSRDSIKLKLESRFNWGTRLGGGAGAATVVGGGATAIGAAIGALLSGVLTGGLGAVAGAAMGAQIGGAIGGGIGALAFFNGTEDTILVKLEADEIKDIVLNSLAIIWGLSVNGFGRDKKLDEHEISQLKDYIAQCYEASMLKAVDWTTIDPTFFVNESLLLLEQVEKIW